MCVCVLPFNDIVWWTKWYPRILESTQKYPKMVVCVKLMKTGQTPPGARSNPPSQSFQLGSLPLETHSDVFYGSYVNVHSDVFYGGARSCVNLKNNATQWTAWKGGLKKGCFFWERNTIFHYFCFFVQHNFTVMLSMETANAVYVMFIGWYIYIW